jgi:hypothetical protein
VKLTDCHGEVFHLSYEQLCTCQHNRSSQIYHPQLHDTAKSQDLIFATCLWILRHVLAIFRVMSSTFCDTLLSFAIFYDTSQIRKDMSQVAKDTLQNRKDTSQNFATCQCPCNFLRHSATCLRFLHMPHPPPQPPIRSSSGCHVFDEWPVSSKARLCVVVDHIILQSTALRTHLIHQP